MTSSNLALVRANSVVDKYQIIRLIKSGGMGDVYEARHVRLGRRVAIKFLRAALVEDAAHQARFDREACVAGSLEHENIAALFDIGNDEHGVPFIVMEYVSGETLRKLIDESAPFPVPRAIAIALQMCAGLQAAHARGIIHRDLKPDNLMVSTRSDGRDWVRVLDFGIARMTHAQAQPDVTATGVVLGTAHYMSPEQARGEAMDARSDIHAVGAILYELLSGEKVHPGDTYNTAIYHVLRKEYVPLDTLRPTLPYDLVQAVHRALASQPSDRFASVEDFADTLAPFAKTAPQADDHETITGTRKTTRPAQPNRWLWGWSIVVVMLLLGYLSLRQTSAPAAGIPIYPQVNVSTSRQPAPEAATAAAPPTQTPSPVASATPPPSTLPAAIPSTSFGASPVVLPAAKAKSAFPSAARKRPPASAASPRNDETPPLAVPEGFVDNPYGR